MSSVKVVGGGAALVKELAALVKWAVEIDLAFAWTSTNARTAGH